MRVLMVGEAQEFRNKFYEYLQRRGIDVYLARGPEDARALLLALKPHVTTLDMDFIDGDTFTLIEEIRRAKSHCLTISGKDQVEDRIRALSLGADDCLTKPLHLEELYLRLRNIVTNRGTNGGVPNITALDVNGVKVDVARRALLNLGGVAGPELTENEFTMLRVLAEGMDRTISKQDLSVAAFARPYTSGSRLVDVCVSKLRIKLRSTDIPVEIRSVRQAGYMMSRLRAGTVE